MKRFYSFRFLFYPFIYLNVSLFFTNIYIVDDISQEKKSIIDEHHLLYIDIYIKKKHGKKRKIS